MMIVTGANALAHRTAAAATFGARHAAPVEFRQQRLGRRPRVAVHRVLDRHLVAEFRRVYTENLNPDVMVMKSAKDRV
jgi:hypothetical protein